ncbi:MAG: hypothetical protein KDI12_04940 [Anaerolineae bacterium]|nr:hypothetical protein [Anaerolineae bacterium]
MGRGVQRHPRLISQVFAAMAALIVSAGLLIPVASVLAAPPRQGTVAAISSPASGATVTGAVQINGSALHPDFDRYELYYTVEPGENWVFIGEPGRQQVDNGFLGTWNTGGLPDGNYSLRLRVVRRDGNYDEGYVRNVVVANTTPPTATPEPTATPGEIAPLPQPVDAVVTPTAEATATPVSVEQPDIPTATPRPSPTATPEEEQVAVAAEDDSGSSSLTSALDTDSLRSSFVRGITIAGAIFLAAGAFFGIRRLLTWIWYLIAP